MVVEVVVLVRLVTLMVKVLVGMVFHRQSQVQQ